MRILLILPVLTLAGCGIAAKVDARQNYQQSLSAYKECAAAAGANLAPCEGKRVVMEADARAFGEMSNGLRENGGLSNNVTINQAGGRQ